MNAKIYNGNVQPNPKEFKIWVNDEGIIKTWNGTEWIESASSGGSDNSEDKVIYYEVTSAIKDFTSDEGLMYFDGFKLLNGGTYHFMNSITFDMIVQNDRVNTQNYSSNDIVMMVFIPFSLNINNRIIKYNTFEEILLEMGQNPSDYIKRRVTAEEYWNTEIPGILNFNIVDKDNTINEELTPNQPYRFVEGMTWEQWLVSDYNTFFDKISNTINPEDVVLFEGEFVALSIRLNGAKIKWTDAIISTNYTFSIIG